jgi:hypothetical protein
LAVLVSPWLLAGIVVAGAALRVAQYMSNRALWSDEAYLALNLLDRSPRELAQPLDFHQAAPILFLLLENAAVALAGASEYTLRFLPLVCGILSLGAFALLAKRVLHPAVAPLALLLFAAADGLIYYSSELKPYSLDVFAAVALLLVGDRLLASRASLTRVEWIAVTAGCAVLLLASYAALFVAAGVALSLLLDLSWRSDGEGLRRLAPVAATWAVAATAALLLVVLRTAGVAEGRSFADPSWVSVLGSAIASSLAYSPGALATKLAAGVAAAGFLRIALTHQGRALLLSLPFVFTMIAVFLGQYPLFARTVLFLVPLVALFLAEGVAALALLFRGRARAVAAVTAGLLVATVPLGSAADGLLHPRTHEEIKPVLGFVARHRRSEDTLYLHWGSQYAFRYYAECNCFDLPGGVTLADMWPFVARRSDSDYGNAIASRTSRLVAGSYRPDAFRYFAQVRALETRGRVWILFSHPADADERTFLNTTLPQALERNGTILLRFDAPGAGAYLFEFDERSSTAAIVRNSRPHTPLRGDGVGAKVGALPTRSLRRSAARSRGRRASFLWAKGVSRRT